MTGGLKRYVTVAVVAALLLPLLTSKAVLGDVRNEWWPFLRDELGGCPDSDRAASGM